jgi:hypothetical protein
MVNGRRAALIAAVTPKRGELVPILWFDDFPSARNKKRAPVWQDNP